MQALILCDSVKRRARTGEPSVVRAFQAFYVKSFPATTQPFCVWMQVTDGNGKAAMKLIVEYVPPGNLEPEVVVPIGFGLTFRSPNEVLEHLAVFENGIDLEQSGRYRLKLTANGTTISRRYFAALRAP